MSEYIYQNNFENTNGLIALKGKSAFGDPTLVVENNELHQNNKELKQIFVVDNNMDFHSIFTYEFKFTIKENTDNKIHIGTYLMTSNNNTGYRISFVDNTLKFSKWFLGNERSDSTSINYTIKINTEYKLAIKVNALIGEFEVSLDDKVITTFNDKALKKFKVGFHTYGCSAKFKDFRITEKDKRSNYIANTFIDEDLAVIAAKSGLRTKTFYNRPSLQTKSTGHSQTTSGSFTLENVSSLCLPWKVSSETNYDYFTVELNGEKFFEQSGEYFGHYVKEFSEPTNVTITMKYRKDGSGNSGEDAGYLHNIFYSTSFKESYLIKDGNKIKKPKKNIIETINASEINVRYIRDYLGGSTANLGNHWVEVQAIDKNNTNVALKKSVKTVPSYSDTNNPLNLITDGNYNDSSKYGQGRDSSSYIEIDLKTPSKLKEIKVWHYYSDGRSYYKTKTEVSEDGITWYSVFDSSKTGIYAETSAGKTHDLSSIEIEKVEYLLEEIDGELTEELFLEEGIFLKDLNEQLPLLNKSTIESDKLEILMINDKLNDNEYTLNQQYSKLPTVFKMDFDIDITELEYVESFGEMFIISNISNNDIVKLAYSLDSGENWLSYKNNSLIEISNIDDGRELLLNGMDKNDLKLIPNTLFIPTDRKIRFAVILLQDNIKNSFELKKLAVEFKHVPPPEED